MTMTSRSHKTLTVSLLMPGNLFLPESIKNKGVSLDMGHCGSEQEFI